MRERVLRRPPATRSRWSSCRSRWRARRRAAAAGVAAADRAARACLRARRPAAARRRPGTCCSSPRSTTATRCTRSLPAGEPVGRRGADARRPGAGGRGRLVEVDGADAALPASARALRDPPGRELAERHAAHAALADVAGRRARPARLAPRRAVVGPTRRSPRALEARGRRARSGAARTASRSTALDARRRSSAATPTARGRGCSAPPSSRPSWAAPTGRRRCCARPSRSTLGTAERTRIAWLRELFDAELRGPATARVAALVEIADAHARRGRAGAGAGVAAPPSRSACYWSYPDAGGRALVVDAAERMPVPPDRPELLAVLALADPVGRGAGGPRAARARAPDAGRRPGGAAVAARHAATAVGAFDLAPAFLRRRRRGLRAQGRLGLLARAQVSQAWARRPHRPTAPRRWPRPRRRRGWPARPPSRAGRAGADLAGTTLAGAARRRGGAPSGCATAAEADAAADGRRARARRSCSSPAALPRSGPAATATPTTHLRRLFDPADLAYHRVIRWWAIGDLVDAAVHSGRARRGARRSSRSSRRSRPRRRLAVPARRAALRAAGARRRRATPRRCSSGGRERRRRALAAAPAGGCCSPTARGCAGGAGWPTRARRCARRATRSTRSASTPWGERARQELRASGETSRRRRPTRATSSPRRSCRSPRWPPPGLTNREIGERLYLSHRTVSTHLYRIFPKLGITSRGELRDAVG